MKIKKTVYYEDLLRDDFANNGIRHKPLPENFKFVHKDPISGILSFLVYRLIALPVLWIVGKISKGVIVKGKKNLKSLRHKPVFFYGNHTQIADAWLVQTTMTAKKCAIIANQDATSIPGIRYLVSLLGCVPVPETPEEHKKFVEAIRYHVKKKHGIVIYPEAHIWPYYTRIRPFGNASFVYPAEMGVPVVPFCVTYRQRKIFKNASPLMTVHVGKPIYPKMDLPLTARKDALRGAVYEYMLDKSCEDENVEYIRYLPKKKEEAK